MNYMLTYSEFHSDDEREMIKAKMAYCGAFKTVGDWKGRTVGMFKCENDMNTAKKYVDEYIGDIYKDLEVN